MRKILSPSILASDFWKLGEQIDELEAAGAQYLHLDVMDGEFVPAISFGMPLITSIRKKTDLHFDVHLMIGRPERYVKEFCEIGGDTVTFHIEATKDVQGTIDLIHESGKRAGISIKPGTPAEALEPYLDKVEMILVMTVEPGFGGQKLIADCVDKIRVVRRMIDDRGLDTDVQVDGGVNLDNVRTITDAGANVIVAGSSLFKDDIGENTREFLRRMKE